MKLAITGFSNSGKTTVFNALTGLEVPVTTYPTVLSAEVEPHHGVVKVPDIRVDRLSALFQPKKTTYATVEYIDFVGITTAASGGDISQNRAVFDLVRDADAIVHVVRAFEDDAVIHPMGSVDPLRDVRSFEAELILGDLEFVEKRLQRIDEAARKGKKQDEADRQLLLKCKSRLEDEQSLRDVAFNEDEKRLMLPYQFLTTIPEIIVLNVDEKDLHAGKTDETQRKIASCFENSGTVPPVVPLCGKIEMEIVQLDEEEARAFLDDLRISEPAMHRLCHISYESLGLLSFLTIGKDEVRAWTIRKGTKAQQAAGKVHSDIERGFIRAEVVSYDHFTSSGNDMVKAREGGLVRLEGKTYVVQDGDIINFKFNV